MIGADDASGQRADVGAPVPADLGLVAHAAEGDADELAAERARDRLAERGLADAGRPDEREHGTGAAAADDLQAALGAAGAHGEVLDDAVLHVVQAVVVGVEHLARGGDVGVVLGASRSTAARARCRARCGSSRPRGSGRSRARACRPRAARPRAPSSGRSAALDAGAVVVGAVGLVLAELLADRGELLAQQELALALVHALADVVADLLGDLELGEVLARPLEHAAPAAARRRASRAARASARRTRYGA